MLVSDPSIIHSLGWSPKVSFNEMAKMMVNQ
jgi:GDP-D-mannose dehydratase